MKSADSASRPERPGACRGKGAHRIALDCAQSTRATTNTHTSYAGQFTEGMAKPDAVLIEGIPPAVAIQQKSSGKNPRSTVATVTEIYDFLRVLYARIGTVHCEQCGRPVRRETARRLG